MDSRLESIAAESALVEPQSTATVAETWPYRSSAAKPAAFTTNGVASTKSIRSFYEGGVLAHFPEFPNNLIGNEDPARVMEATSAQFYRPLLSFFNKHGAAKDADELASDVLLRVYKNYASYTPAKGKFTTWLFAIAYNRFIDWTRLVKRESKWLSDDMREQSSTPFGETRYLSPVGDDRFELESLEDIALTIERSDERSRAARLLNSALNTLPPEQRRVIELHYFNAFSQEEIAKRTGAPLGTTKTRLRLGLQKLRTFMSDNKIDISSFTFGYDL